MNRAIAKTTVKMSILLGCTLFSAMPLALADGCEDLDKAWAAAAKAGDVDALVALYAPDAVVYLPDAMEVRGKDAIHKAFSDMFGDMKLQEFVFLEQNYETRGPLSVGWGRFKMTMQPKSGGETITGEGRFTSVAEKKDGKWVYVCDHASHPVGHHPDHAPSAPGVKP